MKKFIYHSETLRCRVRYIKYLGHFELQIQERRFFVFWANVHKWMTVQEGFWGESDRHPVLRTSYQFGNNAEAWKTGTLVIENRIKYFFKEYFQAKKREAENYERIKNIL
jgi:hypothetical protein